MAFRNKLARSVIAGLTCMGLLSGCASDHRRKVKIPWPPQWPQQWAHPTWKPQQGGKPLAMPADPSGSPYGPSSPRELYVPSGPAPESTLGLPVPPPLPPSSTDASPSPERLPPAADDLDISFRNEAKRRPENVPPPPANPEDFDVPRVAERDLSYERYRQPVRLDAPEVDRTTDGNSGLPARSQLRRTPVEDLPSLNSESGLDRRSGHTPPFESEDTDDSASEEFPDDVERSDLQPTTNDKESLPLLRDPDETELNFPGVHKQTSANKDGKSPRVERAAAKLSVDSFRLTRDSRSDGETEIIQSKSLKRGQNLVVRTEVGGLKQIQRGGQTLTKVTFHFEIRDSKERVLFATAKATSAEPMHGDEQTRPLMRWLAIPSSLKPGKYVLQLHLQDVYSRQAAVVEMPVEIK